MRNYTSRVFVTSLVLLVLAALSCADARFLRTRPGFKQARSTRGFKEFKDGNLQVGRGFGKRASVGDASDIELLEEGPMPIELDGMTGSFPLEWIADKMENNPIFARSILRKFVDLNGDGQLTMEELLRPTY